MILSCCILLKNQNLNIRLISAKNFTSGFQKKQVLMNINDIEILTWHSYFYCCLA
jgi:hypothetical protein